MANSRYFSTLSRVIIIVSITAIVSVGTAAQTAQFRSLCEKYVLDCPINIQRSSGWLDIAIVEKLLQEYLEPEGVIKVKETENIGVEFDGEVIHVYVRTNDESSTKESLIRKYQDEMSTLLQDAFRPMKQIEIHLRRPDGIQHQTTFIRAGDLKEKYREGSRSISYDAAWTGIMNAANGVSGFELDPKTETLTQAGKEISTHPTILSEAGFVNRFFLTIEMRLIRGDSEMCIQTLLRLQRRRASSNAWSEIQIGDGIYSVQGRTSISSAPVLDKIKEVLRK